MNKVDKTKRRRAPKSAERPNYLAMPMPITRPEILERYGRRVARIIADARKGENIEASVAWCCVSTAELRSMRKLGVIGGGFDDKGNRTCVPITCNI